MVLSKQTQKPKTKNPTKFWTLDSQHGNVNTKLKNPTKHTKNPHPWHGHQMYNYGPNSLITMKAPSYQVGK
jgi:hypothetical protein